MSQHTPGPWDTDLRADREGDWYAIEATIIQGRESGTVADTLNRDYRIDPDEDRANARLIAAAPDLLEAAIQILAKWDDFMNDDGSVNPLDYMDSAHFAPLREAVAKATGQGGAA